VCRILLAKRGFDLAMYKDRCVKRRVATRVRARGFSEPRPYLALLERDEAELDALLAALTIHVTQFFRNPSTFALLEQQVLPALLHRVQAEGRQKLRLWSVGCASGEEPYSLALLMRELAPPEVKVDILGTDISTLFSKAPGTACMTCSDWPRCRLMYANVISSRRDEDTGCPKRFGAWCALSSTTC
jgi:chemotaxis methyl-accepting protein methylase